MKKISLIKSLNVADKFLLCFLVLFFAQIAYALFTDSQLSPQTASLDVVFRTPSLSDDRKKN